MWLILINHTVNPFILKGPDFLKFYLMLVLGLYVSFFTLRLLGEGISKLTFYFMVFIFLLGIVKLMKGILSDKPLGFLLIILLAELSVTLYVYLYYFNKRMQ